MSFQIKPVGRDETYRWVSFFNLLAVRQSEPILAAAGIPTPMATAPDHLREIALDHLRARKTPSPDSASGDLESYLKRVTRLVQSSFDRISAHYGQQAAIDLYQWAWRNYVSHWYRTSLWTWSILFPSMARSWERGSPVARQSIDADTALRFVHIVRDYYNDAAKAEHERLTESARQIGLSAEEHSLVEAELPDPNLPTEEVMMDSIEMALWDEESYLVWKQLDSQFTSEQREAILAWARAEGAAMSPPWSPDRIQRPSDVPRQSDEGETKPPECK